MRDLVGLLLAGLLVAVPARGQDAYRELALQDPRPRGYEEAFAWPAAEGAALVVVFRIPNSQLVFEQTGEGPHRRFVSRPEVTVEVRQDDRTVGERIWSTTHRAADFDATQDRAADVQGAVAVPLSPGRYSYRIRVADGYSKGGRQSSWREVDVPAFDRAGLGAAVVARSTRWSAADGHVELANLGGDVPFGEAAPLLVPLTLPPNAASDDARLRWRLLRLPDGADDDTSLDEGVEVGAATVPGDTFRVVPDLDAVDLDVATMRWADAARHAGYVAVVDVESERLRDGSYALETTLETAGNSEVEMRVTRFNTHWRERPLALFDVDVAIATLSFIEDRDVISRLVKGTERERLERLRSYWKERDPSPETAFNELMAEYYRRVDHAAHAFRTGVVPGPDGLSTDRAHVYIRNGPPADVERLLPDRGGVEETWAYPDGRRFVFRAATSYDAYRLVE